MYYSILPNLKRRLQSFSFLLLFCFSVTSCGAITAALGGASDHYSTCFYYGGQWSPWQKEYLWKSNMIGCSYSAEKDIIGLQLYDAGGNVYYSFRITNYIRGQKSYSGIVEYYVNDSYPTAMELAKYNWFVKPNFRTESTPSVKRTARATIKIVNDEKKPAVFNLWYDGIGVGISVRGVYFH